MREDYHFHTLFSDDSKELVENQIDKAISLGLDEICFTDHVDYGVKKDRDSLNLFERLSRILPHPFNKAVVVVNVDYPAYFKKLNEVKEKYKDKITIKKGLEFGVQTHTIDAYNKLYDKYKDELDFTLLSIHQVDNEEFWNQNFQKGKTQDEYNIAYYKEMLNVVKSFDNYSCLAHIDMLVRYDLNGVYPFEKYKDILKEIFEIIIPKGKGIEINASSWRYNLPDTTPNREILKLYKEMGGKIITVGSDAHDANSLAKDTDKAVKVLKEIGFEYICTFESMKPSFHKI